MPYEDVTELRNPTLKHLVQDVFYYIKGENGTLVLLGTKIPVYSSHNQRTRNRVGSTCSNPDMGCVFDDETGFKPSQITCLTIEWETFCKLHWSLEKKVFQIFVCSCFDGIVSNKNVWCTFMATSFLCP